MKKTETLKNKILKGKALDDLLTTWHRSKKRIVFTNGCFDLMHYGHIDYLSKASEYGDVLIIGLNSDLSVRSIKGSGRPIMDERSRALVLAALFFVDAVALFDEDTPYDLIAKVQPDFLVKGSDYKPEEVAGYDIVKKKGGDVITIDLVPGYSTSSIEKRIKEG
jgi:rfaE bifunctional protein nucleotidyltransferase chain/domain